MLKKSSSLICSHKILYNLYTYFQSAKGCFFLLPCDFENSGVLNRSSFSRKIHHAWLQIAPSISQSSWSMINPKHSMVWYIYLHLQWKKPNVGEFSIPIGWYGNLYHLFLVISPSRFLTSAWTGLAFNKSFEDWRLASDTNIKTGAFFSPIWPNSNWLVVSTQLKNMLVNLDHFPKSKEVSCRCGGSVGVAEP